VHIFDNTMKEEVGIPSSLIWGNKYASHISLRSELLWIHSYPHTRTGECRAVPEPPLNVTQSTAHSSPQWRGMPSMMRRLLLNAVKERGGWFSPCHSFWGWLHMKRCHWVVSLPMSQMGKVCLTKWTRKLHQGARMRKKWHLASAAEVGKANTRGPAPMHPCRAMAAAGTCGPHCCRQNTAAPHLALCRGWNGITELLLLSVLQLFKAVQCTQPAHHLHWAPHSHNPVIYKSQHPSNKTWHFWMPLIIILLRYF